MPPTGRTVGSVPANGLWNSGLAPAASVNDLVIAATAIVHGAVVLHDDAEYEHIAKVSELNQT